jgi:hypothetical protein
VDATHHYSVSGAELQAAVTADPCLLLAPGIADRYRLLLDRAEPNQPRWVAIARNLDERTYAIVTRDADEIRLGLARDTDQESAPQMPGEAVR